MPDPWSSEHIARIRDAARRLAQQAGDQEDQLQGIVREADIDAHDAEAALRAIERTQAGAAEVQRATWARVRRSRELADAARRACVGAREQLVSARRLVSRLDGQRGEGGLVVPRGRSAVLVVDDMEETRELVAWVLRDAGFVVRTASNGVDGFIAAYEMQPAVIVMDMMMPVLDGIEATRLIKATPATRDARVIAYTANPTIPDVLHDRLFAAVLQKPSPPDLVVAAVQNVATM